MVESGTLQINGTINTLEIDQGFNRINSNFKDVENQAKQTGISVGKFGSMTKNATLGLVALGIAGVTAMTSLASKSPVLAGTMAKIEVETLKLSNTLGNQMKPIFETIANDLIPSINQAFANNDTAVGNTVDRVVSLVEAMSDLISLDWKGLVDNLDEAFAPKIFVENPEKEEQLTEKFGPFAETVQRAKTLISVPGQENYSFTGSLASPLGALSGTSQLFGQIMIDSMQWVMRNTSEKDMQMNSAEGLPL